LELLRSALAAKDLSVRAAAAQSLLARGDKGGAKAFLAIALESPVELEGLEPPLQRAFVMMADASLVEDLVRLRGRWPDKIERKDNDKRAMAAVAVRAALAKIDPRTYLKDYEDAIDQLLASPISGVNPARLPWEEVVPQKMELLDWCMNLHYVPYIGRLVRPMLPEAVSDYGLAETIHLLADAKAIELSDALETQVNRPVPMYVKDALCNAAGRLPIKGLDAALRAWSKSARSDLQEAAKRGLERVASSNNP
jgi:hypothetical protein